jgi:hypothetical protein
MQNIHRSRDVQYKVFFGRSYLGRGGERREIFEKKERHRLRENVFKR